MNQKIKLKNGTEIVIQVLNSSFEMIGENERRDTLFIIVPLNNVVTPEYLKTTMFTDTKVLDSIEVWGEFDKLDTNGQVVIDATSNLPVKEWRMQSTQELYNKPCNIDENILNKTATIKLARSTNLEQQLEQQQAQIKLLAEMQANLVGGAV